jgi:hypothetical protein
MCLLLIPCSNFPLKNKVVIIDAERVYWQIIRNCNYSEGEILAAITLENSGGTSANQNIM